jgi:4-amino-4-deoxy-L-arabinose transferase-like glycosyltransferase
VSATAAPTRDRSVALGTAWPWIAVGLLTAAAFALRLAGLREGLFGDELYLYEIVKQPNLGDVLSRVHDTESTPPFHFVLAWAATKLGEPTVTVRLPSLILGTALVPFTYLLGARTVGRVAGLLGATFVAISPFAIWYADEARAYATMTFLAVAAALALLRAVETRSLGWWAAYALCAVLILYTHYMGVFVVVALAAWAFWTQRDRLRELLWAHGAIVVLYLPWLPSFAVQSDDTSANRISSFKDFTPKGVVRELTISVDGHPFLPLSSVPGRLALVLLGLGAAAALAGTVLLWRRIRDGDRDARRRVALIWLLALATPVGVAAYSIVGKNTYIPRNLSAALPFICLALGAGVAALRRPLWILAAALVLAGLAIGTVRTLDPDRGRPPYRAAAHFVDDRDRGGGIVLEYPLFPAFAGTDEAIGRHLEVHFDDPHPLVQARSPGDAAWNKVPGHDQLFVVTPWDAVHRDAGSPLPARFASRFRLVDQGVWRGLVPVAVFEYERR